jgi:hypothetical protein
MESEPKLDRATQIIMDAMRSAGWHVYIQRSEHVFRAVARNDDHEEKWSAGDSSLHAVCQLAEKVGM